MSWIERPPRFFRALTPRGLFRLKDKGKKIYLTFDDGPIPEVTPWVLDLLDNYGVKATFFMVGDNARRYPEIACEVLRRGHKVGNHTLHHLAGHKVKTRRYLKDIEAAREFLPAETPLFRPPHGWLRPRQARVLSRRYKIVMYDLVTRDYSYRLQGEQVLENVKRYARPGSIIVFHDSIKAWPRLETALPQAIEWLINQGYTFELI